MEDYKVFEYEGIDPNYLDLFQIKLLAGRNLTMSDSVGNILINNTLAKALELGSPEVAVGKELKMGDGKLVTVVGIVDDFYSNSLKEGVDNIVMKIAPNDYYTMSIKLTPNGESGLMQEKIQAIEKIWTATFPDFVFNYQFFDDNIKAFYEQEQQICKALSIILRGLFNHRLSRTLWIDNVPCQSERQGGSYTQSFGGKHWQYPGAFIQGIHSINSSIVRTGYTYSILCC